MKPEPADRATARSRRCISMWKAGAAVALSIALQSPTAHADTAPRLLAELSGDEAAMDGNFGLSVALDGDLLVVGASNEFGIHPDTGVGYGGSVTVFRRGATQWTIEAKLIASDAANTDNFGAAVAIDGDMIVVGSSEHRDPSTGQQIGAVYVFRRHAFSWFEEAILRPSDGQHGDDFGWSVDVSDGVILVGAPQRSNFGSQVGSGYIFRHQIGKWAEEARFSIDPQFGLARFGTSVAFSGADALVGAWGPTSDENSSGAVFSYRHDGNQWSLTQRLQHENIQLQLGYGADHFAWSIAADPTRLVVGAPASRLHDFSSGAVFLFDKNDGVWEQRQELDDPFTGPFFNNGGIVALSGNFAATSPWQGVTSLFRGEGELWAFQDRIEHPSPPVYPTHALAVSGRLLAVGSGGIAVRLYDLCPTDINADGVTDPADLGLLLGDFGTDAYPTDFNNDGVVDTADLGILIQSFGEQCP